MADWHDLFALLGTAAATLIGAMFVVVSIGSGFLTPERGAGIRVFLTPTIVHLSIVLFGAALTMVPRLDGLAFGVAIAAGGALGLIYSGRIALHTGRHNVDTGDRLWYGVLPLIGYGLMLAAAVLMLRQTTVGLDFLALAMSFLVVAAIRNAWDMILFLIGRVGGGNRPDRGD
ncbi:MAG: hypothetical protein JO305_07735 [Alphaproteobacteria bacterium]|nr:hypothetical protein [Alphaproteobacteria bacterium]